MNASHLLLLWRRIAAFLYDCLLLFALFFFFTGIAIQFNRGDAIESPWYSLALLPIAVLFFIGFWFHGGQTLGMRAWRIKLVNKEGEQPGLGACVSRALFGTLLFGITYIAGVFSKTGATAHDRLSSTRIIRANHVKN